MPLQNDPPSPWLGAFKEKNIPQPIQAIVLMSFLSDNGCLKKQSFQNLRQAI